MNLAHLQTGLPSDLSAKERELAQRERAVTLQEFAVKKQGRDIELEVEITAHQELTRMFQKKALCHQETVIAITSGTLKHSNSDDIEAEEVGLSLMTIERVN